MLESDDWTRTLTDRDRLPGRRYLQMTFMLRGAGERNVTFHSLSQRI